MAESSNPSNSPGRSRILIQLDTDAQPSVFDGVVAVDADVGQLFSHGAVALDQVPPLVHGAIFTRSMKHLKHTAIFIGGSDVSAGEALLQRVVDSFIGPLRVSVMLDANGANTTAAAAVLAAGEHLTLSSTRSLVLGGTGPVGQRSARLLAAEGTRVVLASRSAQRATTAAAAINKTLGREAVQACATADEQQLRDAMDGVELLIAAGAAGVELVAASARQAAKDLKVAIDLNAVPPLGIEGIDVTDNQADLDGAIAYGAVGVGGTKMKIHKAAIKALFESNDRVLDAEQIYEIGKGLR